MLVKIVAEGYPDIMSELSKVSWKKGGSMKQGKEFNHRGHRE